MSMIVANAPNGMSVYKAGTGDAGSNAIGAAVAAECKAYADMAPAWGMVETLWEGTRALRRTECAKHYLPQFPKETPQDYANRIKQSVLTNYYKRTIKAAVGKVFKKPITFNDDVPEQIKGNLLEDIDSYGNDANAFGRELLEGVVQYGVMHVLVDWPQLDAEMQAALANPLNGGQLLEKELGVRPYWVAIKPTDVIGWKAMMRGGQYVLTQVRVKETVEVTDPTNEFATVCVKRVRVYDIGRVRVFELRKNSDQREEWINIVDAPMTVNGKVWDRIPLVTVYANRTGYMQAEPMLQDLAYLNVAHFQSDSDQRNLLHVARVPILFYKGSTNDEDANNFELEVGAGTVTKGGPDSDMKFVEHTGKAMEAGTKDLADLEVRMAEMALGLVTKSDPGNPTATAKAIDTAEAASPLQVAALSVQDGIDQALDLTAKWMGIGAKAPAQPLTPPSADTPAKTDGSVAKPVPKDEYADKAGGTCKINTDFGLSMQDASAMATLLDARKNGDLSRETFWSELMRRGYLSDDFDAEEEAAKLEAEGPPMNDPAFGQDGTDPNGDPLNPADASPQKDANGNPPPNKAKPKGANPFADKPGVNITINHGAPPKAKK
jgi:hypothetical protein